MLLCLLSAWTFFLPSKVLLVMKPNDASEMGGAAQAVLITFLVWETLGFESRVCFFFDFSKIVSSVFL